MKKIILSLIAIVFAINLSHAQYWTGGPTGPIYYNSGNVGIGTSSPANTLDVSGGINTSGSSSLNGVIFNTVFTYYKEVQALGYDLNILSGDGNSLLFLPYTSSSAYARFQNYGLVIDGSVGIGTTTPATTLDVNGTGNFSGSLSTGTLADGTNTFQEVLANSYYGIPDVSYPGQFRWYASPNNSLYKNNALYQMRSWDAGTNTENTILTLTGGGNVGIGTTTPDQLLSVAGNIHAEEVLVNLTGFEDRVFKKTYHLPTLTEVKAYIDQNHHLPGVPSEGEVMKNGLKLGDMDRTLTKKVEELTLYLIEKDKQLNEQQTINREQANRLDSQQQEINQLKQQINTITKALNKK